MAQSPGSALASLRWSKTVDPEARTAATAPALAARMRQWEDQVDPDRQLDPDERDRLVTEAKSAHFAELGRRSAAARRARAEGGQAA